MSNSATYEDLFYAWAIEQARLLRAELRGRYREHRRGNREHRARRETRTGQPPDGASSAPAEVAIPAEFPRHQLAVDDHRAARAVGRTSQGQSHPEGHTSGQPRDRLPLRPSRGSERDWVAGTQLPQACPWTSIRSSMTTSCRSKLSAPGNRTRQPSQPRPLLASVVAGRQRLGRRRVARRHVVAGEIRGAE